MAEVVERVARLEEKYDAVRQDLADVKAAVARVDGRLEAGLRDARSESRTGLADLRADMNIGFAEHRAEANALRSEMTAGFAAMRQEMQTHFRWMMGGLGGAVLAILLAMLSAVLVLLP